MLMRRMTREGGREGANGNMQTGREGRGESASQGKEIHNQVAGKYLGWGLACNQENKKVKIKHVHVPPSTIDKYPNFGHHSLVIFSLLGNVAPGSPGQHAPGSEVETTCPI